MTADDGHAWRQLGAVPPDALVQDRLQLHHAVQLLAAFGQNLLEARPDDSHRSMTWDGATGAFRGGSTDDGLRATLRVAPFHLSVESQGRRTHDLSLAGVTLDHAFTWLAEVVGSVRGVTPHAMDRPEYEIPGHPVGEGEAFRPSEAGLGELARWYHDASLILESLRSETPEASAVRCWPHHFDMATLLTLDPDAASEEGRSVGVGFSPGDEGTPEPYWYVNVWPYPDPEDLPPVDGPGRWHTEGWVGAVLDAGEAVATGDAKAQGQRVRAFVDRRVAAARSVLER